MQVSEAQTKIEEQATAFKDAIANQLILGLKQALDDLYTDMKDVKDSQ